MNITPSLIYWITRLDNIIILCICSLVIGGIWTAFMCALGLCERFDDEENIAKQMFRVSRKTLLIVIVASLILVFVPRKKDIAAMIVIPRIANGETVTADVDESVKTLAIEWLEELRSAVKKGKTK